MISAILAIGGIGLFAGLGLAIASKIFYVYVDPTVIAVEEALPGANCGGCGFPGCSGAAAVIASGKAPPTICVGGGAEIHREIAAILGVEIKETEPEIALPGCRYGSTSADLKYIYDGFNDCRAALLLDGGSKECPIGCLGLGSCVKSCPFGALSMGPDNLPVVNAALCTGCGSCERVCPKHIITLSSNSLRIQKEYATDQCTAPCQRSCPAGIDIPRYIQQITEKNYSEAIRTIKEANPFPSVCGRICVQPCEDECRRNLVDEPVAINNLKRFAADYEMGSGKRIQISQAPKTGNRIAVVGGGAEGLTAAYFLDRLGHETTVYETSSRLGGILRIGLPENRLPAEILDWDINGVLDAGVKAMTRQRLGRDFTVESLLKQGASAVFIATGGWDTILSEKENHTPSPQLPGAQLLVNFILDQRSGTPSTVGEDVMILGGGNASLEAARMLLDRGAKNVYVVVRSPRDVMPFDEEALKEAEIAGVQFYFESALIKMLGQGNQLTHAEIAEIVVTGDESNTGDSKLLPVDSLLLGAGRFPELIYIRREESDENEEEDAEADERPKEFELWETLSPYPSPSAEHDMGIFRPGEVLSDYKAIVEAIGSGRRAANSIHKFLTGEPVIPPENMIRNDTQVLSLDRLEPVSPASRQQPPELSQIDRIANPSAEITLGYSEDQAVEEANRCLKCGLICYRRMEGDLH